MEYQKVENCTSQAYWPKYTTDEEWGPSRFKGSSIELNALQLFIKKKFNVDVGQSSKQCRDNVRSSCFKCFS